MGKEVKSKSKQKRQRSGCDLVHSNIDNKKQAEIDEKLDKELVISKIEHTILTTPPIVEVKTREEKISDAAKEYRLNVEVEGVVVEKFVGERCKGNLLKMKLVLWSALQSVEGKMRRNREGS